MHLYEITESYQKILAWMDEPNIEISDEILKEHLANISEQLKDKAENIGKMILDLESESDTAK